MRGRRLKVPGAGPVRPTQDAVREALFSILAQRVPNCVFLDLFAGSGSVGLEAWSRGAKAVTWVESHRSVARILSENVATLCNGDGRVVDDDVFRWLKRPGSPPLVDIAYADPPYGDSETDDRIEEVMALLSDSGRMAPEGLFVAEQRAGRPMPKVKGWNRIKDRRYGHTRLTLFTYTGRNAAPADASDPDADPQGPGTASHVPLPTSNPP